MRGGGRPAFSEVRLAVISEGRDLGPKSPAPAGRFEMQLIADEIAFVSNRYLLAPASKGSRELHMIATYGATVDRTI